MESAVNSPLRATAVVYALGLLVCMACRVGSPAQQGEKSRIRTDEIVGTTGPAAGVFGGSLRTTQRTEPETFNPLSAVMMGSRDVLALIHADLIHINRRTLRAEPSLASSWDTSADGRTYTIHLRSGLRFSDGYPMDADDVVFTFGVHLDPAVHSPQRDLLIINGHPIAVTKLDASTIRFTLSTPYAAAERLFDGIAILPRHLLREAYASGRLTQVWGLDSQPASIAGLGPFQLEEYLPGQRLVVRRNPYYWKQTATGQRLPFLDRVIVEFVPSEDAQILRLRAGELDVLDSIAARNYVALQAQQKSDGLQLFDAGPGLEYSFLVFNQNVPAADASTEMRRRYSWFTRLAFRRAVSEVIDRDAIVKLVYRGLGNALSGPVTRGNALWVNSSLPELPLSIASAKKLLEQSSFSWKDGTLLDPDQEPVQFSILVSASNSERLHIASLIQQDLTKLGMKISVLALDPKAVQDRILNRGDYDAALMTLASADADPNSEISVWSATGRLRVWNLKPGTTAWEAEADTLMRRQMTTLDYGQRKVMFDQVQQLVAENLPIVSLASPHVLAAARPVVGGLAPAHVRPYTLWNAEMVFLNTRDTKR